MRGAKLLKISSILLIITGIINIILGYTNLQGMSTLLAGIRLSYFNMILMCVQGIAAVGVGVLGILSNSNPKRVKTVMTCAWIILLVTFLLYFMSYGYSWGIVLYELLDVISAIIYFWGARRNEIAEKK